LTMPTMIKARLTTKSQPPFGGSFRIDAREKGLVGVGTTFEQLLDRVRAYRHANGLPNGLGLEEQLEQEICARYPSACKESDPRVPPSEGTVGGADVVRGSKVMLRHWMNNRVTVSQEEANRRAAICANCAWQRTITTGCGGKCGEIIEWLATSGFSVGTTPYDDRIKSCGVCHCLLKISVWVPLDLQTKDLSDFQKEQFKLAFETQRCWKGKGL